jgi:hypothetical protein
MKKLYQIRPLKWTAEKTEYSQEYKAYTPFGEYWVSRFREEFEEDRPWEGWKWGYCFDEYYDEEDFECSSLKDGKERAMKHWTERLEGAIRREEEKV